MRKHIFLFCMAMMAVLAARAQERTTVKFNDGRQVNLYQNDYDEMFVADLKLQVSGIENIERNAYPDGRIGYYLTCTVTVSYDLTDLADEYKSYMAQGNPVTITLLNSGWLQNTSGAVICSAQLPADSPMKSKMVFRFGELNQDGMPILPNTFSEGQTYYLFARITKPGKGEGKPKNNVISGPVTPCLYMSNL